MRPTGRPTSLRIRLVIRVAAGVKRRILSPMIHKDGGDARADPSCCSCRCMTRDRSVTLVCSSALTVASSSLSDCSSSLEVSNSSLVDCNSSLIGLHFLVRRFEFFVGGLQFLIGGLEVLVFGPKFLLERQDDTRINRRVHCSPSDE